MELDYATEFTQTHIHNGGFSAGPLWIANSKLYKPLGLHMTKHKRSACLKQDLNQTFYPVIYFNNIV